MLGIIEGNKMKKRINKKIKIDQKRIAIFTGIVFLVSLIPILYLSGYVQFLEKKVLSKFPEVKVENSQV